MSPKQKAWKACSKYIRLRDALKYCEERGLDLKQFIRAEDVIGVCCTCGTVKSWSRMDAGHYKSRGMGGSSGVYFDERNIHLQCKPCNGFEGGRPEEHKQHIIKIYGQDALAEIELRHKILIDMRPLAMAAMKKYYDHEYKMLCQYNGIK